MMPGAVRSASENSGNSIRPSDSGFENYLLQQNAEALASTSPAQPGNTGNDLQNPAADSLFPPTNPDSTVRLAADTESTPAPDTGSESVIKPGSPQNRFVGAGIVQRAPGQTAAWILMTPSGKVLADLKPASNLPLDQFLGRQVGVQGSRWSQKDRRDIIEVTALEPVRLRE
jgi:hypothetical protein